MNLARISLESRRGWILDVAIYDLWWNENEQKKATGRFLDEGENLLQCCVELAKFQNLEYMEKFYKDKLNNTSSQTVECQMT